MTFRMPRPSRRPDSRNAQFSQRIPTDLLGMAPGTTILIAFPPDADGGQGLRITARCGKTHVRASLGTDNPKKAVERQALVLTAISDHWKRLRGVLPVEKEAVTLSPRQCASLAGEVYRTWQSGVQHDPALSSAEWRRVADEFEAIEKGRGPRASRLIPSPQSAVYHDAVFSDKSDRCALHVSRVLDAAGLRVTPASRRLLTERVFEALKYNALAGARMAEGDFRPDPEADRFPEYHKPLFKAPERSFADIYDDYARVPGKFGPRRPQTIVQYRTIFVGEFGSFISEIEKVADPLAVRRPNVAAWRDHLLSKGLAAKTIADVKLAAVRAVYERQVKDGKMDFNPAEIGFQKGRARNERPKGFTDAEALDVLAAARGFKPGRQSEGIARAIRWTPFLAAATGARIAELCQARREDFELKEDGWWLTITPEAGNVKNDQSRTIPLHSGLMALGFEEALKNFKLGPLFYNPPQAGKISHLAARVSGGRVGEWVREVGGIADKRISPNHAWRHRFNTLCRQFGVDIEYREFITGRSKKHQGEHYGDMAGLRREIERIPAAYLLPIGSDLPD